jgi:hypothetical protein
MKKITYPMILTVALSSGCTLTSKPEVRDTLTTTTLTAREKCIRDTLDIIELNSCNFVGRTEEEKMTILRSMTWEFLERTEMRDLKVELWLDLYEKFLNFTFEGFNNWFKNGHTPKWYKDLMTEIDIYIHRLKKEKIPHDFWEEAEKFLREKVTTNDITV